MFKDMKYLDSNRVELHYELPLNEIVYDFFDALKSRTKGYASLDYELLRLPAESELVKLDILLNGDSCGRAVLHRARATRPTRRARRICEKLQARISRASCSRCPSRPRSAAR